MIEAAPKSASEEVGVAPAISSRAIVPPRHDASGPNGRLMPAVTPRPFPPRADWPLATSAPVWIPAKRAPAVTLTPMVEGPVIPSRWKLLTTSAVGTDRDSCKPRQAWAEAVTGATDRASAGRSRRRNRRGLGVIGLA